MPIDKDVLEFREHDRIYEQGDNMDKYNQVSSVCIADMPSKYLV